jgi:predicted flap endonuclease-1-like 5' DNA nuclease
VARHVDAPAADADPAAADRTGADAEPSAAARDRFADARSAGDADPDEAPRAVDDVVDLRDASSHGDAAGHVVDLRDDDATRDATRDDEDDDQDDERDDDEEPEDDDLERIEGVTPKIAAALHGSGIHRYRHLAACDEFRLRGILRSAGLRFSPSLPSWPEQAELLADGDDAGFAELSARVAADRRTAGTA